jgi:MFS family permease
MRSSCIVRDIGPRTAPGTVPPHGVSALLRRTRVAVIAYFVVLGLADGVWLARIPAVKQHLGLSDGLLGLALLAAPAGLVLVAAFADRLIDRFGSARLTVAAGVAVSLLPVALGLAGDLAMLMAALLAFGVAGGLLDVAMNSQAVRVEREYRRPLITSFHACYSFGGLAGALLGGLFAWAGVGPVPTFTAVGVPLAGLALLAGRGLAAGGRCTRQHDGAAGPDALPGRRRVAARIAVLGVLALCCLLSEGAIGSWSAVYLRDNLRTSAGLAAMGYAAFSVTMAAGRLQGDWLAARIGRGWLVSASGLVGAVGLAGGLIIASPVAGLAGFALCGAGMSSMYPQLVSAAGNVETSRAGTGIARVAGAGYLGLVGGPVLIGGCASLAGLRLALGIPVVLMLCVAAGGRSVTSPWPAAARRAHASASPGRTQSRRQGPGS